MAGLGKSTLIRNRIQESGKQYLKFPISGHIDLETLVGRLRTFESVRKNQRSASDGIIQLDEAIIRWDKLQPFTVIFTEWNDPLFVYKNINDVPRSLIDTVVAPVQANIFYRVLFSSRLKHEQQQREQAQFPDHNQLKHEDFFMRLAALSKKYYSKPVCNSCFKQYEDTDQTCASCGNKSQLLRPKTAEELDIKDFQMKIANQLEKEYVWTADNYIKALLIYLRIQCRLPVILIGETGSKNCTSESVLKVFERAEKYLGVETSSNILPVIVFDEIGLAELSTHNPLKVLHSKLEIETCKYGFVGISNWHLDAAKMNRALYLACPDPDKDELKLTAETISSSLLKDRTKNTAIDDSVNQQWTRTLIGSSLPGDSIAGTTYSEQYNRRVLMDIILHGETNITLMMRRMDHIYANLYDLFNQNFHISGHRKYCRIAFDNLTYQRVPIHEDFFCIILAEQKDLIENDPPFLNRFEKHVVDTDSIIHRCYTIIASNLLQWIDSLVTYSSNKHFPQRKSLFVDYNPDNVRLLVMDAFDSLKISEDYSENQRDVIIGFCKEKLIRTSSFDLPLLLSCHMINNDKLKILIDQYYKIHNQLSFSNIIDQALEETMILNQVIYTYTQIYDKIEYLNHNSLVMEIKIGGFKSEFELKTKIKEHYQSKNKRLLLIRVDYHHEYKHLLFLKHLIQNGSIESSDHGVWLVLHLQRNLMDKIQDDILFNGWCPVMIDNLNQKELMQIDVLTNPSYRNLLDHADFSLSHTMFNELVTQSFVRVRYTVRCKNKEGLINQRRDSIFDLLILDSIDTKSLNEVVKTHLIELIKTADLDCVRSESNDWRQDLFNNPTIVGSCRSIDSALQMTVLLFYCNYFLAFLVEAEKSSLFDSCYFLISKRNENMYKSLRCIWLDCLRSVFQSIPRTITIMDTVEIPLIFDLRLPCARLERQIIRQIYEMIKNGDENLDVNLSEDKLLALAMEKLRSTSVYGKNIQDILDDTNLFKHYFHDQIAILLDELGINHLSVSFAQKLLTMNPSLTVENKMKYFLLDQDELIKLLNLFEIGLEIIGEDKWQFEEQFLIFNKTKIVTFNNPTNLYVLIQVEQQFYQILPQESFDSDRIYECNGDPLIETSLMNLIELLVSSTVIDRADDIVQLSTAYDFIVQ
ncbi:unnamed protein product, partial [Rotaria sp. Silwood1]